MMIAGKFISIEGGEGVGKSTQIIALAHEIRRKGHDVILTREPGGTQGAEVIRQLLLSGCAERWGARTEALLFAAARSDHVERLIRPAIESGKWVITDRYLDSSRAYQGGGSGIDDAEICALHKIGSNNLLPDRTLVLELPGDEASYRVAKRDDNIHDRIGGRDSHFHDQVANAFRRFAAQEPQRIRLIDASGDTQTVTRRLILEIEDLLQ